MKRYIRASITVDDMVDGAVIPVNNYEEYCQFDDAWYDYTNLHNLDYPKVTAEFTDSGLIDISKHLTVDQMISRLSRFSHSTEKQMKERLKSVLPMYHYRLSKLNPKPIFQSLESNIRSLGIKGLRYSIKAAYLQIYYVPDKYKYDIKSSEFKHNVEELTKCFESIPAVYSLNARKLQDGYAWDLTWNMNSDDTSFSYIPDIIDVANTQSITYKVTFVHAPQYMSRAPFRYVDGSNEMYMVSSGSVTTDDDSVEFLAEELVTSESVASKIHTWKDLFTYLDSIPYKSNHHIITSLTVKDITCVVNGKSKKIYSRPLPTTNTIKYEK